MKTFKQSISENKSGDELYDIKLRLGEWWKAHSKQATVVFCRLLSRTLICLNILEDDIVIEDEIKITNDPSTWRIPLELNMKGNDVKEWQKILINNN